jgi:LPS sulfotransferase NodH
MIYLVATSPRSGSWLLCRGLRDLALGCPEEYLAAAAPGHYLPQWGLPPDTLYLDYLVEALHRATSPDGVLGVKAHWYQMRYCLDRFGGIPWEKARYVHLRREDTLRQAISWWRALSSGQWWRVHGTAAATLDPLAIPEEELLRIVKLHGVLNEYEQAWNLFFADQAITPLVVAYERMVANYAETLRAVASFLGITAASVPSPRTVRQADTATDVLAHRLVGYLRATGAAEPRSTVTSPGPGSVQPHPACAEEAWWEA